MVSKTCDLLFFTYALGKWCKFHSYFSDGLKLPTRPFLPVPWMVWEIWIGGFDCFVFDLVGFTPKKLARGGWVEDALQKAEVLRSKKNEPCFPGSWGMSEIFTPHHLVADRLSVMRSDGLEKTWLWRCEVHPLTSLGMMILYLCTYLLRIFVIIEFSCIYIYRDSI